MARTITQAMHTRFKAEAEEAKVLKMEKVADSLGTLVKNADVRETSAGYCYSARDLKSDVNDALWSAAVRTMDFHGSTADSVRVQDIITRHAEELIAEIAKETGSKDGVGAYEAELPGEDVSDVLEVSEES